jgi:hypothetical protein
MLVKQTHFVSIYIFVYLSFVCFSPLHASYEIDATNEEYRVLSNFLIWLQNKIDNHSDIHEEMIMPIEKQTFDLVINMLMQMARERERLARKKSLYLGRGSVAILYALAYKSVHFFFLGRTIFLVYALYASYALYALFVRFLIF